MFAKDKQALANGWGGVKVGQGFEGGRQMVKHPSDPGGLTQRFG